MLESWQTLDLLSTLVEKSLVIYEEDEHGQGRYRMLESVRQYGLDRLLESGENTVVRDRHQTHFADFAQQAKGKTSGSEARLWIDRLEAEYDNLRAALQWQGEGTASVQGRHALSIAASLTSFWHTRGFTGEGRAHLQQLLAATANDSQADRLRCDGLIGAGMLALLQGDLPQAEAFLSEGLSLCRQQSYRYGEGRCFAQLGTVETRKGNLDASRAYFEEALTVYQETGSMAEIPSTTTNLGCLAMIRNESKEATAYFEQAIASANALGNRSSTAQPLHNLGYLAYLQGDWQTSRSYYERSLFIAHETGNKQGSTLR